MSSLGATRTKYCRPRSVSAAEEEDPATKGTPYCSAAWLAGFGRGALIASNQAGHPSVDQPFCLGLGDFRIALMVGEGDFELRAAQVRQAGGLSQRDGDLRVFPIDDFLRDFHSGLQLDAGGRSPPVKAGLRRFSRTRQPGLGGFSRFCGFLGGRNLFGRLGGLRTSVGRLWGWCILQQRP
jgi:hypothetical protein